MISKFFATAIAAGLIVSVTGNADARSLHKKHQQKAMSAHAMSPQATAARSGDYQNSSSPNRPPQTMPWTPIGKDSTAEAPRR